MNNDTIQTESLSEQESQQATQKKSIKIKINVKTAVIVIAIATAGVLAYFYKGLLIAATVNGSPIGRLSIIQQLEKASGKSLLDSLITEKLIQNEAKAKKITVSNDEINEGIKTVEDQIAAQGGTLEAALAAQGMTMEDLKKQIVLKKEVEKLVADKVSVTDEEVAKYIKDNAIPLPKGQETTTTAQIKDELKNQKISAEGAALIADLKSKAKIQYFVNY